MKQILFSLFLLCFFNGIAQKSNTIITSDITNFWKAYDLINKTTDSAEQINIINKEYINKGTAGLTGIMQARRYTAAEYVQAIKNYPLFWNSIRANTLKSKSYGTEITKGITKLKEIYPSIKPAKIFFTIGALRSNGTIMNNNVLIGSELAMTNNKTITTEIKNRFAHLPTYFATNPIENLTFLNVHEFIHTQQKTTLGNSLLAQTVLEGAAEFIATIALKTESPNTCIIYGKKNGEAIKQAYKKELFSTNLYNWIWNNTDNEFKTRDLAYYIGYAICESYYNKATDKKQAIKNMIELDYNNEAALFEFVDASGYFEKPLKTLKEEIGKFLPTVVKIEPFENGSQTVSKDIKLVTIHFSEPMNVKFGDFDSGPLGENNTMWIKKRIRFSVDCLSYTIEIQPLVSNKRYQLMITDVFMSQKGYPLKPFLIDFKTE